MKLTSVFCLMGLLQVSASVYSQQTKLSLTANNVTVRKVIDQIEEQSNFKFLYRDEVINADRRVTVEIKGNIEEVLKEVFAGTAISYRFLENNLIALTNPSEQDLLKISGKVTESSGAPLPGVSVVIRSTTQGTITGANGDFAISSVPADAILVFSFVGMRTQEVPVSGRTNINVVLEEESFGIEEVVAVGYGTQKKVNLTGAVSQVSSEVLESRAITNIGQGLQGVVPNLNVTISNGSPNTTPSYNVRGGTSFSGNSFTKGSPLILVDGFESSDMNLLNPEDIESISVLKDASSAAIYGARAAYGVMLITTKQGKRGERVKVSYNSSFQLSKPVAIPDLLDSYTMQFAQNKAKELTGQSPSASDVNKLQWMKEYMEHPETAPVYKTDGNSITWVGNTDVYGEAVRDWTPFQKHAINVSGGSEKINYYASISYQQQEGLYKISTDIHNRYNILLNLSTDVNSWFSVNYKASFNKSDYAEPYNNPGKGGWWHAMGQQGNYNINMPVKAPKDSPVGEMYTDNILSYMGYGSENKEIGETTLLSVAPTFKIAKGLNLKGDFSYESYHYRQKTVVPELENVAITWTPVISPHTTPSWLQKNVNHQDKFALNIYGDFTQTFLEKHHIYALVGFNQEWMKYNDLWSKGTDLLTSSLPVISQTLGARTTGDSESEWAIRGVFCRLNYNFDQKYLFEFNGRYDGTSKFPTDSRFKFFPSFSAGWRISEENFAENIRNVVNNFKIRGSYGSLGNQNVSNYIYFP
ncbi:MAG: SusC/RagA family TonB-linked outer membrane protein, partial [Mangrovibacterium sp.]|nr:SusC/RagA family TonB-linked outer membrane protein [Mangrovibacterium sp.]